MTGDITEAVRDAGIAEGRAASVCAKASPLEWINDDGAWPGGRHCAEQAGQDRAAQLV